MCSLESKSAKDSKYHKHFS